MTAVRMALCSLFTTLIATGAFLQISLPNFGYFTLQFPSILMAGTLLGARLRALSVALYVSIGLLGIPVLMAGGGISYVLRPSLGLLLGFIVTAFCSDWVTQHGQRKWRTCFLVILAGLLAAYGIGLAYEYVILDYYTRMEISPFLLLLSYFPPDLSKGILYSTFTAYVALRFPVAVCRGIKQERVYARQIRK